MSKQGVKNVVAALLSDPQFNKAFFNDRNKTLKESGFSLSRAEKKALGYIMKKDLVFRVKLNPPYEVVVPLVIKKPRPGKLKPR
jgi:hypothetical protein